MQYLKRFDESVFSEKYSDYLLPKVSETSIVFKDEQDEYLYYIYEISRNESIELQKYLKSSNRFSKVKVFSKYYKGGLFKLIIASNSFCDRHKRFILKNIKWVTHPAFKGLMDMKIAGDLFMDPKQALMPDGYSLIKGISINNTTEFWPLDKVDDPIAISSKDTIELQYLLFKYL